MFTRSLRTNETARQLSVATLLMSMAPYVFGAGTNTYRFTNNEARDADDLHINFSSAIEWDTTDATFGWQNPAGTFHSANGSGGTTVDMHVGVGGAGVAAGGSVDLTFGYGGGKTPQVSEWWWTENHPTKPGKTRMLGNKKRPATRDIGFEYVSAEAPGTLLISTVFGEALFHIHPGEPGVESAARFVDEIMLAIPGLDAQVDPFDAAHVLLTASLVHESETVPQALVLESPCNTDCVSIEMAHWGSRCDFDFEFEGELDGRSFWEHWAGGPAGTFQVDPEAGIDGSPGLLIVGADDAVLNLQDQYATESGPQRAAIDRGRWIATASFRAPDEAFGLPGTAQYLILMNEYPPTSDDAWSLLIEIDPERGVIEDRDTGASAPLPAGAWSDVTVEIDLDSNQQRVFVNGALLEERTWMNGDGRREIAAVDIYGFDSIAPMVWDEVHVVPDLERGACALSDGTCMNDLEIALCTERDGIFMGSGSTCDPVCHADLDGDGAVGTTDLLIVLGAWGTADPIADIDGSGIVGTGDLLAVLGAWGPSCG